MLSRLTTTPRRRIALPAVLAAGLLLPNWLTGVGDAAAETSTDDAGWRSKLDQAALQEMDSSGTTRAAADTIDLLVAAEPDAHGDVEDAVEAAGGTVHSGDGELDYVRVTLPRAAVDDVVGQDDVVAADLDYLLPLPEPTPLAADLPDAVEPPGVDTPAANPFLPSEEIGAVTFSTAHPDAPQDRIRVGVVDTGVDIAHPGLHRDGQPVTKLWTTAMRPALDGDPSWLRLDREATTDGQGMISLDTGTYRAPHEGTFRVGYLAEARQTTYGNDLDGDGTTGERLPVLVEDDTIWTDPDGDLDFTTTPSASVGGPWGLLRVDNPGTAINEGLHFVAQSAEYNGVPYVHLGFDQVGHGTHVAGIIAGNGLYGSQANGVAPGVDVYSVQVCHLQGCPSGAMTDAVTLLARDHDVDVVNISIGSLAGFNNGDSAAEIVYTRIAEEYDTVLTMSAGNNGDGANTIGQPAAADSVLAVGASVSTQTWQSAYGTDADPGVFAFSSRGLREDGALSPQVVAPGAAVSTLPVASTAPGPGYGLKNGTSMAAPMTAGAAALLLGAARAEGDDPSAADIRAALVSGARHLDGENVTSEGAGQVDLERSWQILQGAQGVTSITVDAPVCTPFSSELPVPGRGGGIHQRCATTQGGPTPGQRDFTVTVTRTSGDPGTIATDLRWRTGDDRLSVTTTSVQLPLNTPVQVTIGADLAAGTHLAGLLEIDDPRTAAVDQFLPVSIAVGHQLDPATLTWSADGEVGPGESDHHWVEVPPGTAFSTISLTNAAPNARIRFVAFWPAGVPATDAEIRGCYTDDPPSRNCQPLERTFEEPFPGVWEITVQGGSKAPGTSPYTLQLRSDTSAGLDAQVVLPPTPVGGEQSFETSFANSAGITNPSAFAPLVSENRYERRTLRAGESAEYEFTVPEGIPYVTGRARSVDGAAIEVHATRNGQPIGHVDGVEAGEFLTSTSPGDVIHVTVTATWMSGETTQIWYEDRLHRSYADRRATVRVTGVTTEPSAPGPATPAWTTTTTRVNVTVSVLGEPIEGRFLGTTLRLRLGETVVLAQTPVRFAPPTVPLDIDSGLTDATGAQYTVYEADPTSGVEVARIDMTGTGVATVEPLLAPWPAFDPARTYTVVQTADPAGHTAEEPQVTAVLVNGRLTATFAQAVVEPGSPTPTDRATTVPGSATPTITGLGEGRSGQSGNGLALTGPTLIVSIIALALLAITAGAVLRRRASKAALPE